MAAGRFAVKTRLAIHDALQGTLPRSVPWAASPVHSWQVFMPPHQAVRLPHLESERGCPAGAAQLNKLERVAVGAAAADAVERADHICAAALHCRPVAVQHVHLVAGGKRCRYGVCVWQASGQVLQAATRRAALLQRCELRDRLPAAGEGGAALLQVWGAAAMLQLATTHLLR